ncbi:NAD(P)H-hydrate dehydratase [Rhodobacteraceae bacterium D3-12]|nr:NAD(P)H-hydrate dehydratase [Rhodobacteraceae bacterium D3-12]
MNELLTAAQMRAIESAAIESGNESGLELMERAGRGVITALFDEWPDLGAAPHRAVVFCGPGNNGGDGYVVARLLKEWGWEVEVFAYGNTGKLPPDAKVNYQRWAQLGQVHELFDVDCADRLALFEETCSKIREFAPKLIVDALFGTGVKRALPPVLKALVENRFERLRSGERLAEFRVIAVDVPSGLCSDSGRALVDPAGDAQAVSVTADLTVSFHRKKLCHVLADGGLSCAHVKVSDIGLDPRSRAPNQLVEDGLPLSNEVVRLLSRPSLELAKHASAHKYSHGHALILTGGFGKTGAARLAGRGALRIGAGLVTLGVPGAAQLEVASQVTGLMLTRAGTAEELSKVLEDARINALCLGPGMGVERARALVEVALGGERSRPTVLDADALSAFVEEPEALFAMLHAGCVLTPHGGEFKRLFPDIATKLEAPAIRGPAFSKVDATREAAARAGCVVLFKGADTVIAAPDGQCAINSAFDDRSAPWLATAGSGDVLAGFVTGLLARGFDTMKAAETAAWLHVECALSFGPGLIAEDIPEQLPKVLSVLKD